LFSINDEPLNGDARIYYAELYDLIAKQVEREDALSRALDANIATLLAGVVTGIGFWLHPGATVLTPLASYAYVVKLV
jgi:hypothetical protein